MRILLAEPDSTVRAAYRDALSRPGLVLLEAEGLDEAVAMLSGERIDALVIDLALPGIPGGGGPECIAELQRAFPGLGIFVTAEEPPVGLVVACMKAGACHMFARPAVPQELAEALTGLESSPRRRPGPSAAGSRGPSDASSPVIARSPAMRQALKLASVAASKDGITCLIEGESGTGKEVIAGLIHRQSRRADLPFVPLNCAVLPQELIESELFGHSRGAFTGAVSRRVGLFEEAQGGTLFLDEIGEMPLTTQSKLLRALETRLVRPVGQSREVPVDVRVLAATNRDLDAMVEAGQFRLDLYYRLNQIILRLPPLRERLEDLEPLCELFAGEAARTMGRMPVRLEPDVFDWMRGLEWKGNVRELRNVIYRVSIMCEGINVGLQEIPEEIRNRLKSRREADVPAALEVGPSGETPMSSEEEGVHGVSAGQPGNFPAAGDRPAGEMGSISSIAMEHLIKVYEASGRNKSKAARILGISRQAMIRRLRAKGIE